MPRYQNYGFLLDRVITLLKPRHAEQRGTWNEPVPLEPEEIKVWAAREDISTREGVSGRGDTLLSELQSDFIIRFREDINPSWSIVADGQNFRIEGVRQIYRKRFMILEARHIRGG